MMKKDPYITFLVDLKKKYLQKFEKSKSQLKEEEKKNIQQHLSFLIIMIMVRRIKNHQKLLPWVHGFQKGEIHKRYQ